MVLVIRPGLVNHRQPPRRLRGRPLLYLLFLSTLIKRPGRVYELPRQVPLSNSLPSCMGTFTQTIAPAPPVTHDLLNLAATNNANPVRVPHIEAAKDCRVVVDIPSNSHRGQSRPPKNLIKGGSRLVTRATYASFLIRRYEGIGPLPDRLLPGGYFRRSRNFPGSQ